LFIVVVGGGYIGENLVRYLTARGERVAIVEKDGGRCDQLCTRYEAMFFEGDATKEESFRNIEMTEVDVVLAVTNSDDVNISVAQMSKAKFGVPYVIARVNHVEREEEFKRAGADATICPPREALASFESAIERGMISILFSSSQEDCRIALIKVPSDSIAIGKSLDELRPPENCNVCAISRRSRLIFPTKETVLQADDRVFVVGSSRSVESMEHRLTSPI
jgi:trk system potassium uptake protein TrkA